MALPFLPHRQISPMFLQLQAEAETEPLQNLVTYIRRQWIESTVFLPRNWSVYQQAIRTNNDIEGWHNALNSRASGQSGLPLYLLIELLDREARLTAITTRLVSEKKLSGSSESSIGTCRRGSPTAGRSMRGKRRPPHSC